MKDEDSGEILLPDKLDVEETSPYPRRPRAVSARRSRFSKGKILKWSVFGLVVLTPLAYVSFRLGRFARNSPRFAITSRNDVTVEGNHFATTVEIMNALGLPSVPSHPGGNAFLLPLDEMRTRVEAIPWVKSATLTRAFPHRLVVHVVERQPVAFVNVDGGVKLVDADGVILEKPDRANFAFPMIEGLDAASDADDRRARIAMYQTFMQQLSLEKASSGWIVSEVDLSDADDLKAVLIQGDESILVHFGHQDFAERFHDFQSLVPDMRKSNPHIGSVDLRYRNQVVVSSQAGPGAGATRSSKPPKE
jgi:cell division protein FtsQ